MDGQETLITEKRGRRGPEPTGQGKLIGVRLHPPQLDAVDKWRRGQEDLPSRPEAIRRLVAKGLDDDAKT